MNLPNKLTMLRIMLAIVFIFLVNMPTLSAKVFSLLVFILAALTDWFDGKIAKSRNLITDLGKFMDPLADKVLVFSAFLSFLGMQLISVWMVIVIISRELIITGLRVFALSQGKVLAASKGGKHKTVSQMAAIFIILLSLISKDIMKNYLSWQPSFDKIVNVLIYFSMLTTVILTLVSGLSYFWYNRKLFYRS